MVEMVKLFLTGITAMVIGTVAMTALAIARDKILGIPTDTKRNNMLDNKHEKEKQDAITYSKSVATFWDNNNLGTLGSHTGDIDAINDLQGKDFDFILSKFRNEYEIKHHTTEHRFIDLANKLNNCKFYCDLLGEDYVDELIHDIMGTFNTTYIKLQSTDRVELKKVRDTVITHTVAQLKNLESVLKEKYEVYYNTKIKHNDIKIQVVMDEYEQETRQNNLLIEKVKDRTKEEKEQLKLYALYGIETNYYNEQEMVGEVK